MVKQLSSKAGVEVWQAAARVFVIG